MRIIVPIKQVPETSNVKMDPVTGTIIRTGLESIINPLDLYALETALRFKDREKANVIVLTMGPNKAFEALREALALGCDEAILLSHKAFGGSDTWATAYALSLAIQKIGIYDLILCGERATDGETGQVGPELAAFLDIPLVTFVRKLNRLDEQYFKMERSTEWGMEDVRVRLPALITVLKEIASPRLPTLRGMQKAKATSIPVWGPEDIGADPSFIGLNGSPTRVVKIENPKIARGGSKMVAKSSDEINAAADQLIKYLHAKNLI